MKRIDAGVIGRFVAVGAVTGAVTGFAVWSVAFTVGVIRAGSGDIHMNPNPNMGGFVLAAIVGAVVGLLTGLVAGLALLLPAAWLRHHPIRGRVACAVAGGGAMSLPFLVVGLGWGIWPEEPLDWAAAGLVAVTAGVSAGRSRYILVGRTPAGSGQVVGAPDAS